MSRGLNEMSTGVLKDSHCLHLLLQRIKLEKKVLKRRWGMTRMCCWLHRCAPGACNGYLKSAPVPKNSSHSETAFSSVQFSSRKVEDSNKIRKMTRGPGHGHNQSWWILILFLLAEVWWNLEDGSSNACRLSISSVATCDFFPWTLGLPSHLVASSLGGWHVTGVWKHPRSRFAGVSATWAAVQ